MSTSQIPLLSPQKHEFKPSRNQSVLSNYDPSAYPPDLQFARAHARAQNVGHYIPPKEDTVRCPCCLQPIHKPKLDLGCELRQILHLGCAYTFYFIFIKQCAVLLLVNIIISSIPSLIINVTQGNMCAQLDSQLSSFYRGVCRSSVISIMNVAEIDMLEVQAIINFISIIISIIVIGLLDIHATRTYYKFYNQYDILPRASDYSVIIKGLPKDITISQICEFIVSKLKKQGCVDCTIHKLYLIYNLKTYYSLYVNKRSMVQKILTLEKKYKDLGKELQQLDGSQVLSYRISLESEKKQTAEKIGQLENKKELIQLQINNYQEIFKLMVNRITNQQPIDPSAHKQQPNKQKQSEQSEDESTIGLQKLDKQTMRLSFSGKCIVTLNSVQSKNALSKQTKKMYFLQRLGYQVGQCLGQNSSSIVIYDAPQPRQIIFSNIGYEKIKRWRVTILVTLSLTFLILLDFVVLTLQKKFIKEQKSINSSNITLSFLNSQVIALFNSLVSRVIRMTENKTQMHSTQSSYYYSVTIKLVFMFLINMLVTTFFSNFVNYYLINQKSQNLDRFPLNFQQYLFDIFFLLLTNPIISFTLIYFDHRQGYKLYKRYQIENKNLPVTQAQANLYYQNMPIDLSNKYSNIYRFVLFGAGVCFIFPPALIICLATISVLYWQDKYLVLRRYVIAHKLSFGLTERLQKILWLFPVMLSITNLIIMFVPIQDGKAFQEQKYSKAFYYLSIIALITSVIVYLGGCNWVVRLLQKFVYKNKNQGGKSGQFSFKMPEYKDIQMDFQQDYWHHYPYFKVKNVEADTKKDSPRKQKVEQLHKKTGMNVFTVIKNHLHQQRYSPMV